MFEIVQQRLAVKLGLLTTVAVAAGFMLATTVGTRTLLRSTARLHRESASGLAASISASIRTTMLAGDGGHVRRLVAEVKTRLPKVGVRVFSSRGEEVFGEKPPAPPPGQVPAHGRAAAESGKPVASGPERSLPIVRGDRCGACHKGGLVLGVLTVGAAPSSRLLRTGSRALADSADSELDALTEIIRDGFYRVMLAPAAPRLDEYFAELARRVPGVRAAAVYAPDKSLAYGKKIPRDGAGLVRVATLRAETRCLGCHESAQGVDSSTLVVAFDRRGISQHETLSALIETVLEQVLEAGLGRLVIGFLDDVARTGAVRSLTLHDAEGRLFHDAFGHLTPPADVDSVLRTGAPLAVTDERGAEFRFVEPLRNRRPCQTCHGSDQPIRGAIEIRLNTSEERAELANLQRASVAYGVSTIVLVLTLLALGLYYTVIRPVQAIGSVADLVGAGRLDTTVDIHTRDEMGRLGQRVNEMVRGLRQKLELSKFVSRDTLREVEANVGAIARGGERRRVAVVFSDIRGFTPFAESREPEAVVEMLNRYLQAQAEVVIRHGGDIDKFVGDEIMARFTGPGMALRATRAAVDMVAAVEALNSGRMGAADRAAVGVGVNVGDAVLGAMGAEQRMDFTAIGDTVNTAARLCAAAGPGEVLVTEAVRRELDNVTELVFSALEPMHLKGKHEAVSVYRVTPRRTVT